MSEFLKGKFFEIGTVLCILLFEEKLSNNKIHNTVYLKNFPFKNSDVFKVPGLKKYVERYKKKKSKFIAVLSSVG